MADPGEPRDRVPNAQSPKAKRWNEQRALNYTEEQPDRASVINELYALTADPPVPVAESGDYGTPLRVSGYDHLMFWLEGVVPDGATMFHIQLQYAHVNADAEYLDQYEDELRTGTLARKVFDIPGAGCWRVLVPAGVYARAQLWCTGGGADTRATLKVTRGMWAP